jgi:hypothetical protein
MNLQITNEHACCEKEENLNRIFVLKNGLISVTMFCEKCGHLFLNVAQTPTFGTAEAELKPFNIFGDDTLKNIPKNMIDLAKKLNKTIDYLVIIDGSIKDYEGIINLMNQQRITDGKNLIQVLSIK